MKSLYLKFTTNFNLIPVFLISFLPVFIILGSGILNAIIIILGYITTSQIFSKNYILILNKNEYIIVSISLKS